MAVVSFNLNYSHAVKADVVLDPGNIVTLTGNSEVVTVKGVRTDQFLVVRRPATLAAGIQLSVYASAKDQATIVLTNSTAADINPGSLTFGIVSL